MSMRRHAHHAQKLIAYELAETPSQDTVPCADACTAATTQDWAL
jgi:hypothetical protein